MKLKTEIYEFFKNFKIYVESKNLSYLVPTEKEITDFCSLINDVNPIYLDGGAAHDAGFEGKLIPPGYIMTLPVPIIREIFLKFKAKVFSDLFKGLIHVKSEIEYIKPMLIKNQYKLKIELLEPIKKRGKKGVYYSLTFRISILDINNIQYVIDNHEFFLKYK